jgi:heptosyltransferase-3
MNRILVIRGGALGDFILTLPAIKLLREKFPKAHIEILGYKHIAGVAEKRFYADRVRSLESGLLAGFFVRNSKLPVDLAEYFTRFDLIVSYLFDPDRIFEENLRRCRIGLFITGPSKLDNCEHAAFQLARPLEALGLHLKEPAGLIYPSEEDRDSARQYLGGSRPFIALHPGSGSETKNWPINSWLQLGDLLLAAGHDLLVIAGEAEEQRLQTLDLAWTGKRVRFVQNRPLPELAALLEGRVFVGHDSGISHVAAAVGARCILLFGWTDPAIWAPANKQVLVLRAPEGNLSRLAVETVIAAIGL